MIWNPWREIKRMQAHINSLLGTIEYLDKIIKVNIDTLNTLSTQHATYEHALRDIADMETPRCSNVVRKAARVAREALHK